jgi:membrane-associated phospholipid phosphatase
MINPLVPITIITAAVVVCASRIRLGHHTLKQVGAGILVGTIYGSAWFLWWYRGGAQDIAWEIVDYLPRFLKAYIR